MVSTITSYITVILRTLTITIYSIAGIVGVELNLPVGFSTAKVNPSIKYISIYLELHQMYFYIV